MANLYLGGSNPIGNVFAGGGAGTSAPTSPIRPVQETPQPGSQAATQPPPPNVLGPQALRPTGGSGGFDPQYLQNLVTSIGGLFSRPQGGLNFNPLGDLSQSGQTTGFGNAPVPGLPNTMLQDALSGLGFAFQPPAPPTVNNVGNRGNNDNGFGGRGPRLNQL